MNKTTYFLIILLLLPYCAISKNKPYNLNNLSGWAISESLFKCILEILPPGSTILEFGSGTGTKELAKFYTMYSIENNKKWLDKYNSTYIYAPIKDYKTYQWYDTKAIRGKLPQHYDLILIDGPHGGIGREGFLKNLYLFDLNAILVFDDTQRRAELELMKNVAEALNRKYEIFRNNDEKKSFGIIFPEGD